MEQRDKLKRVRKISKKCRMRRKLRYQYLEERLLNKEKAILDLKTELENLKKWSKLFDSGDQVPKWLIKTHDRKEIDKQPDNFERTKPTIDLSERLSSAFGEAADGHSNIGVPNSSLSWITHTDQSLNGPFASLCDFYATDPGYGESEAQSLQQCGTNQPNTHSAEQDSSQQFASTMQQGTPQPFVSTMQQDLSQQFASAMQQISCQQFDSVIPQDSSHQLVSSMKTNISKSSTNDPTWSKETRLSQAYPEQQQRHPNNFSSESLVSQSDVSSILDVRGIHSNPTITQNTGILEHVETGRSENDIVIPSMSDSPIPRVRSISNPASLEETSYDTNLSTSSDEIIGIFSGRSISVTEIPTSKGISSRTKDRSKSNPDDITLGRNFFASSSSASAFPPNTVPDSNRQEAETVSNNQRINVPSVSSLIESDSTSFTTASVDDLVSNRSPQSFSARSNLSSTLPPIPYWYLQLSDLADDSFSLPDL